MATKGKPKKKKYQNQKTSPKLTKNQAAYKHEIEKLARRIKTAEKAGFAFPSIEEIVGEKPQVIKKKDIEKINKIRRDVLYQKAISYEREGRELPISEGIISYKEKLRETSIKNLPVKLEPISEEAYYNSQLEAGKMLLKNFYQLSGKGKMDFIHDLSNEDYEAFSLAQEIYGEEYEKLYGRIQRNETGSGGQTGQAILPNESSQYAEEPEEYEEDEESEIPESERAVDSQSRREQIETPYEEIKNSEKARKWKEKFDENKNKHYTNREYINQGEAIYFMILDEIDKFEEWYSSDSDFRYSHEFHNKNKNSLKNLLELKIKEEGGVNNLMRRLDGRGLEVHSALENMLYFQSDRQKGKNGSGAVLMEDVVGHAYMQLADIINNGPLTQQQSMALTENAEIQDHYVI